MHKQEIDSLSLELNNKISLNKELNEKLQLSEQQEQLIRELKTKAHQFEEYIKTQSSSPDKSKKFLNSSDKSVSTSPELQKAEVKKIESRIRDEMAKIFAMELKRFQVKLQQTEEQVHCLQREYQHASNELQQRQTEVDLLKEAILAERETMAEILKQKDAESTELVQKQNNMLIKCSEELKVKNQKISELNRELQERQTQIEAERQSMKRVMAQWEAQRKNVDNLEAEWQQKIEEMKKTHEAVVNSWQSKYNSAKRTAANYKVIYYILINSKLNSQMIVKINFIALC